MVSKEMKVCTVVRVVVGAAVPWLLGDGIGRGDTMIEDMTGTTGAELEGETDGTATAELLEDGTAAPLKLTGSGMIVSVTGVTPADETGVIVVVSVPIVNERENVGTMEMLELEAGGGCTASLEEASESGAAVLLLLKLGGAEVGTTWVPPIADVDVEAAFASDVLEDAADWDTGCVMVETKVDRIVEIEVVVCVYVVPEMVIVAVTGQIVVVWYMMSVVMISEATGAGELEGGVAVTEVDGDTALASAELEIATGEELKAVVDRTCEMVETKVARTVETVVVV
ncbi:hypothetical protein MMC34_004851 [Xylographa carneopallida]|nr:hypothetical protein [Xylographa carneopallida]